MCGGESRHLSEEWRPVVGFEGFYEVSNYGSVRSLDRQIGDGGRGSRLMRGRVISLQKNKKSGYLYAQICGRKMLAHRLVLEAFVGRCPDGMECCHNDSDKTNNFVGNLRWDTRYNNVQDIRAAGTHWQTRKTHCPMGHIYDATYTINGVRQTRVCRTCQNASSRRSYRRKKQRQCG